MTPTSRSTPSAAPRSATSSSSSEDYPNARDLLLEQNYRSTQTILSAANAVISRNRGRKAKQLWSDAGHGAPIVGYVADNEHDEAAFVASEIDKLTDAGLAHVRRHRGLLPHQRAVAGYSRRCSSGSACRTRWSAGCASTSGARCAMRWRTCACWPTPRTPCRFGASSTCRSGGSATGPRRACEALAERERITFWQALRRVEDASGLAARSLTALLGFRRADRRPARPRRRGNAAVADPRGGARPNRVPRRAAGVARPAGREPAGEPAGARRGGRRVRGGRPRTAIARRLPRAGGPRRRLRRDPRGRRARRRRHADDAAHRQGPGVPGRVPHRSRGRRLPAPAVARRPDRAGGGAPAGVRRDHPRAGAAVRLPRRDAQRVGVAVVQPGVAVPRGAPQDGVSWQRVEAAPSSTPGDRAGSPRDRVRGHRAIGSSWRWRRGTASATTRSVSARWWPRPARASRRRRRSTSAARGQATAAAVRPGREASRGSTPRFSSHGSGSTGSPPRGRICRCRCDDSVVPVFPTRPMSSPTVTSPLGLLERRQVAVVRDRPVPVLDDDHLAVLGVDPRIGDGSGADGIHRRARLCREANALVFRAEQLVGTQRAFPAGTLRFRARSVGAVGAGGLFRLLGRGGALLLGSDGLGRLRQAHRSRTEIRTAGGPATAIRCRFPLCHVGSGHGDGVSRGGRVPRTYGRETVPAAINVTPVAAATRGGTREDGAGSVKVGRRCLAARWGPLGVGVGTGGLPRGLGGVEGSGE